MVYAYALLMLIYDQDDPAHVNTIVVLVACYIIAQSCGCRVEGFLELGIILS